LIERENDRDKYDDQAGLTENPADSNIWIQRLNLYLREAIVNM
jgi:hypothetical protein